MKFCKITINLVFTLMVGMNLLNGQSFVEINIVGNNFDTSKVEILQYEHMHVGDGPILLRSFEKTDKKKKFRFKYNGNNILIVSINGDHHNVFIAPNSILYISLQEDGMLHVVGNTEKENSTLYKIFGSRGIINFPKLESQALSSKLDGLNNIVNNAYKIFGKNKDLLLSDFQEYLLSSIVGYEYFVRYNYLNRINPEELNELDKGVFYNNLPKLDSLNIYNQPYSRNYMNALLMFLRSSIDNRNLDNFSYSIAYYYEINEKIPRESPLYNLFLANMLNSAIYKSKSDLEIQYSKNLYDSMYSKLESLPETRKYIERLLQLRSDQILIKELNEHYLENVNSEEKNIIKFDNEYLILDFWATWCEPCIQSFEELKIMKSKNDLVDVHLINISDSSTKWKSAISKYNLDDIGENYHAKKGQSQILYSDYKFETLPHFILIDKKKKILFKGNSKIELFDVIDKLKG